MIFCFTGSGNSLHAAQKPADEGEEIVSVVDTLRGRAFCCTLKEGEKPGFMLPVCFCTVSDPVLK